MPAINHDLVVIGAGIGGYVAAIRAAQLGLNVGIVEKESALGGTCLRIGCIPSKALLESSERFYEVQNDLATHGVKVGDVQLDLATMLKRKDKVVSILTNGVAFLMKKNKITRYTGHGRLAGAGSVILEGNDGTTELGAKSILIATGSKPAPLPGVEVDGDRIGSSTEALSYAEVPKHLVIIGGGYIGMELGSVWRRLGAKVTVVEFLDHILPGLDAELAAEASRIFVQQGFEFRLKSKVKAARRDGSECIVEIDGAEPIRCDRVLLAVGRVPNTENLGLDAAGVKLDERGRIAVDNHFNTSAAGVCALGDVISGPMLAHKAEEEGVAFAEQLVTGKSHINYDAIPAVVYTHPEIASVGRTEEQLQKAGIEFRKGVFFFRANGRAQAIGDTVGKVKMLADAKTDRVLGVHIIGPRAGDLIAEAVLAMSLGAKSEDIARTCHAHPTLAEAMKESALAVSGRSIHS
jgi:dihydrolipoamide dehydrogenase